MRSDRSGCVQVHAGNVGRVRDAERGIAIYKLARSAPPYGDSEWRLYDLRLDPTETHDLTVSQPDLAASMIAAFGTYADRNRIVEVPAGYDVLAQGRKNAGVTQ